MSALPDDRGAVLLSIARESLEEALLGAPQTLPDLAWTCEKGATFVTLRLEEELRGCVGTLEAVRTLAEDVRSNALAAAFRDSRFSPLTTEELLRLRVEVSLLSPLVEIEVVDERAALAALEPGVDGVVLTAGGSRSTFLPQVWEAIPEPADFLGHLKRKAGLDPGFWSDDLRLWRYAVEHWSE